MNNKPSSILNLLTILALIFLGCQTKMLYTFSVLRHGAAYPSNDLYDGN